MAGSTTNYDRDHQESPPPPSGDQDGNGTQNQNSNSKPAKFTEDELTLMIRMFNLVGERWCLIAGRIPGRSAREIEDYWTSTYHHQ